MKNQRRYRDAARHFRDFALADIRVRRQDQGRPGIPFQRHSARRISRIAANVSTSFLAIWSSVSVTISPKYRA